MVLVRNIANESKREPLKIARIDEIKESRDNVQRVVILTYHNVSKNKNGKWIGTPMTVERSVKDLILVDDALDESMLSPKVKEDKIETRNDKRGLSCAKLSQQSTSFLSPMGLFFWFELLMVVLLNC